MKLDEAIQNLINAISDLETFIPQDVASFNKFFGRLWSILGMGLEELEKYHQIKK